MSGREATTERERHVPRCRCLVWESVLGLVLASDVASALVLDVGLVSVSGEASELVLDAAWVLESGEVLV